MNKTKTAHWGEWVDKSEMLRMHPIKSIYKAVVNNIYAVQFSKEQSEWGEIVHLWIRNREGSDIPWAEKMKIKESLMGDKRFTVEVFPPKDKLVDQAPMYHLYVLPLVFELPFGLHLKRQTAGIN